MYTSDIFKYIVKYIKIGSKVLEFHWHVYERAQVSAKKKRKHHCIFHKICMHNWPQSITPGYVYVHISDIFKCLVKCITIGSKVLEFHWHVYERAQISAKKKRKHHCCFSTICMRNWPQSITPCYVYVYISGILICLVKHIRNGATASKFYWHLMLRVVSVMVIYMMNSLHYRHHLIMKKQRIVQHLMVRREIA